MRRHSDTPDQRWSGGDVPSTINSSVSSLIAILGTPSRKTSQPRCSGNTALARGLHNEDQDLRKAVVNRSGMAGAYTHAEARTYTPLTSVGISHLSAQVVCELSLRTA